MPLLRGAVVGGAAYSMGRRAANSNQREQEQSTAIADLQAQSQYQASQVQTSQAQVPAQGRTDVASRLAQLGDLLQQGVLTQDEFARAKAKVLADG
jgi:membrane protease subunit (stomatin/prohibitin family)